MCRYVVIGVSLVVSAAISLVQCLTCNLCGLGKFLDMIFAGVGFVWWLVAAGVVQHNVNDAPGLDGSMQDYRNATVGMMWAEVSLRTGAVVVVGPASRGAASPFTHPHKSWRIQLRA